VPMDKASGLLRATAEALEWCRDYGALRVRESLWMRAQARYGSDNTDAVVAMEWVAADARDLGEYDRATSLLKDALAHWRVTQ
jgi:predicted P-loop ATPase/GTPase